MLINPRSRTTIIGGFNVKKHELLTGRDMEALNLINQLLVCRTITLCRLVYKNISVTRRRLRVLIRENKVIRIKLEKGGYAYIKKMPDRFNHALLRSDFLCHMSFDVDFNSIRTEQTYGTIRPDAYIVYTMNGTKYNALLEIQTEEPPNVHKYKLWDWHEWFDAFPNLIIISDMPFDSRGLPVRWYGTDFIRRELPI
jgi:hypothetical protein